MYVLCVQSGANRIYLYVYLYDDIISVCSSFGGNARESSWFYTIYTAAAEQQQCCRPPIQNSKLGSF